MNGLAIIKKAIQTPLASRVVNSSIKYRAMAGSRVTSEEASELLSENKALRRRLEEALLDRRINAEAMT